MPLTLVLGPANSAKAADVLGAFADAAPRGALLVVPTGADAEHYSRELAAQGCVMRSVLTFAGLADELARRAGYGARRLSELQREQLLGRVLRGASLTAFEEVVDTPGFRAAALGLLAELERSMVAAPRFAAALRTWGQEDPRREPYGRDLGALYLAYAHELDRLGFLDAELWSWRALDALRAAPGRWGSDPVFFYGFDDLHELQRDAVETLARIVGVDVTVSLTFESGRPALSARAELVAELKALASRVVEHPPLDEYYAPSSRAALHHLERSLFEPGPRIERIDPGPAIRLLEAAGELAEAELVAAEVGSVIERGTPPDDIAVIYRRTPPTSVEALSRTFRRYGIELAVSDAVPLGHTALGHGLLALARCALDEGRAGAEDVLSYLRTPGLLRAPEVADALEVRIRREGLRSVAQARGACAFELDEIDALRDARDQLGELARHGRRLLTNPFRQAAPLLAGGEQLDARALAALQRCARELGEVGGDVRGAELIELLEGLEVTAPLRPAPGAVIVSDPLAIRARRFAAVFICGLQEAAFPWTPPPDPFLPDELRRELAACSGLRLRLREDALDRERYLFYACVSRATEQVVLSYRSSDEEGNIALASPFVDDVADVLDPGWRASRRRRLLADVVWPEGEAPTERERTLAVLAADDGGAVAPAPARRLGAAALGHVRHTEILSAGGLESYAECHMKWLVERELQPLALEPEPEPLARGTYVHEVLERVLSRLGGPITPESLHAALRILEEVMGELSPQLAAGRSAAVRQAVAGTIAADLRRFLEHEARVGGGWPPRALELRFGFEDREGRSGEDSSQRSLPALVLERGSERVALRGAIDRVDVEPGGARAVVRDYKTGSSRTEHQGNRWQAEQRLQVALYMVAVRDLLGLEPVAGLYQPLLGRELRPRGIYLEGAPVQSGLFANDARDSDGLAAELEHACERAVALAAELRAGDLEPCPDTCGRDGCRYPGICRAQ